MRKLLKYKLQPAERHLRKGLVVSIEYMCVCAYVCICICVYFTYFIVLKIKTNVEIMMTERSSIINPGDIEVIKPNKI